jgi:hypothetical protein
MKKIFMIFILFSLISQVVFAINQCPKSNEIQISINPFKIKIPEGWEIIKSLEDKDPTHTDLGKYGVKFGMVTTEYVVYPYTPEHPFGTPMKIKGCSYGITYDYKVIGLYHSGILGYILIRPSTDEARTMTLDDVYIRESRWYWDHIRYSCIGKEEGNPEGCEWGNKGVKWGE